VARILFVTSESIGRPSSSMPVAQLIVLPYWFAAISFPSARSNT
jgi:hypothetical protein